MNTSDCPLGRPNSTEKGVAIVKARAHPAYNFLYEESLVATAGRHMIYLQGGTPMCPPSLTFCIAKRFMAHANSGVKCFFEAVLIPCKSNCKDKADANGRRDIGLEQSVLGAED